MVALGFLVGCTPLQRVDLVVDGVDRSYFQHVPPGLAPGAPVVVTFHGGGPTGDHKGRRMCRRTGFDALADREGFVAVFPDALHGNWHASDLGYADAVVARVLAQTHADPTRVYAAGFSNGAFFAEIVACTPGSPFASIAAVSGSLPAGASCAPSGPVRILMISGTADPVVLYGGGPVARNRGESQPVEAVVAGWVARNGCTEPSVEQDRSDLHDDGTAVHESTWCGGTVREVRLLRVDGGGHAWPGAPPIGPELLVGRDSRELDATTEIWRWFTL